MPWRPIAWSILARAVCTADDFKQAALPRGSARPASRRRRLRRLDWLLADKEALAGEAAVLLTPRAQGLGLEVTAARHSRPDSAPGDIKDLMNKVTEAQEGGQEPRPHHAARRDGRGSTARPTRPSSWPRPDADAAAHELEVLEKLIATGKLNVILGEKGLVDHLWSTSSKSVSVNSRLFSLTKEAAFRPGQTFAAGRRNDARRGPPTRGSRMPRDHDGLFADDVREPGRGKEHVEGLFQGRAGIATGNGRCERRHAGLEGRGVDEECFLRLRAELGEDLLQRGVLEIERYRRLQRRGDPGIGLRLRRRRAREGVVVRSLADDFQPAVVGDVRQAERRRGSS